VGATPSNSRAAAALASIGEREGILAGPSHFTSTLLIQRSTVGADPA
jgi:hypothetical protein